jgi:hypothetical protein
MNFSNINFSLPQSYAECERRFNRTNKPRGDRWDAHERPLNNARQHHYRIEKATHSGADYYDLCLYYTTMARFFKPEDDGSYRVLLRYHSSPTSHQFLLELDLYRRHTFSTTTGLVATHYLPDSGRVEFCFDAQGLLILERSSHDPIIERYTTPERKALRRRVMAALAPYITLLAQRIEGGVTPTPYLRASYHNRKLLSAVLAGGGMPEDVCEHFFDDFAAYAAFKLHGASDAAAADPIKFLRKFVADNVLDYGEHTSLLDASRTLPMFGLIELG